jgi:hypothetical protein
VGFFYVLLFKFLLTHAVTNLSQLRQVWRYSPQQTDEGCLHDICLLYHPQESFKIGSTCYGIQVHSAAQARVGVIALPSESFSSDAAALFDVAPGNVRPWLHRFNENVMKALRHCLNAH